jgi:hypothetical protein
MQKASGAFADDEMAAPRLLHRKEIQAIVLGAALAAIAGNGTKQRSPCVAPCPPRLFALL